MNHLNPSELLLKLTPEIISDMEKIHFCADLHHEHPKIISICNRPTSIQYHDAWLIETFNKYVQKKDTVYILGDLSFAKREKADKFIDRLNGQKTLILGNHDNNIHNSTRFAQITQIKDFSYSRFELNIHIVLCHYKMVSWNRKEHGSFMLHGHSHCRPMMDTGLSFDVGIDRVGLWRIYNLYEICKIMDQKYRGIDEETILKSL